MTSVGGPHGPVLALDTSSHSARVAIIGSDGATLAHAEMQAARHSSNLLRLTDEVLRAAGVTVAGLGGVACGAGPGSFTGLRVGMAVAKGLALPFATPLLLVSSLEALAHDLAGVADASLLVPCIDAGKDQVYARLYRRAGGALVPDGQEAPFDPSALAALVRTAGNGAAVIGGNGADRYAETLRTTLGDGAVRVGVPGPSAGAIARLALVRLLRGESDDLERAVPSYGRPPDITKPKRKP